ncbi:MAG: AAA family ATPase [Deltaproteobacteria bacterium]|jgi:hypothetical protein|nr:AAA family ATPase [Deltaproteobacteria bacterium]
MGTIGGGIPKIGNNLVNFSELRNEGYVYVDKTGFVHELLGGDVKLLFLSRPRRFGKTLLIDTIEEAAVGRKELFAGLAIDKLRKADDWPSSHVLRIGMSSFGDNPDLLDSNLADFLHSFASLRGFGITAENSAYCLTQVIRTLSSNYADIPILTDNIETKDALIADRSKIIILIDEYDSPIINNITNPRNLDIVKKTFHGFYNALKSCDSMIERVFITGITKYAQLSVFSAMNNLRDITFQPRYATICGFTPDEILKCYSPHLSAVLDDFHEKKEFGPGFTIEKLMKRITEWYDGYSWNGVDTVINPISLQNFLLDHIFDNFWIRTGGLNFINQMNIKDDFFAKVCNGSQEFSGSMDIQDAGDADPVAMMLQSGYLTLRKRQKSDEKSKLYLAVPNKEVGMSIMKIYIDSRIIPLISSENDLFNSARCKEFCNAFCQGELDRAEELLRGFLNVIPFTLHGKTESFYRAFLLSIFKMSDFEVEPQHTIAGGIIDLVVTTPDESVLVTEIKYAKSGDIHDTLSNHSSNKISAADEKKLNSRINAAFRNIIKNGYLQPYSGRKNPVRAVAVAVCGKTFVRIRSFSAEELLKNAHELLKGADRRKPGPAAIPAGGDEPPLKHRPPRNKRPGK